MAEMMVMHQVLQERLPVGHAGYHRLHDGQVGVNGGGVLVGGCVFGHCALASSSVQAGLSQSYIARRHRLESGSGSFRL